MSYQRAFSRILLVFIVCVSSVMLCEAPAFAQTASPASDQEVERRVNELLSQMSPEEKMGQLSQLFYFGNINVPGLSPSTPVEEQIAKGTLGSLLFVTDPGGHQSHAAHRH